jgi:hypothetical protein
MTEFLQHLDYYLVASFKAGKRRLKYYIISAPICWNATKPANGSRYAPAYVAGVLVGGLRLAIETEKTQSQEKAQKTGRVPQVGCTHC